ncbi:hypothetical protein AgCh_027024 [Apium graveolens]
MAFRQRLTDILRKLRPATPATRPVTERVSSSLFRPAISSGFSAIRFSAIANIGQDVDNEQHYNAEDIYYELVLSCQYKYINGKHYLESVPLHGLWKNKLKCKFSRNIKTWNKIPVNNPNFKDRTKDANELLKAFKKDHPNAYSKMIKFWRTTNHTSNLDTLYVRENIKHGDVSYSYWLKAMEMADEFFDDEGKSVFSKMMEEEEFIEGTFSREDFENKISKRFGKKVLTTFVKKAEGKHYPNEFHVFYDKSYTKIDYPPHKADVEKRFTLDGPQPQDG